MAHREIQFLAVLLAAFTIGYARAPQEIINGKDAFIPEFPYQVFLKIYVYNGIKKCGGTIIDDRHILTAAHCCYYGGSLISSESFNVITGTDDLRFIHHGYSFQVMKSTPHPNYNKTEKRENDIAILKLYRKIAYNKYRKPAQLPTKDITEGTEVMFAGWGSRTAYYTGYQYPYLQKFETTVINLEKCKDRAFTWAIHATHICTYSPERKGAPCHGDSGGSLTSNGVVVGVLSQGACTADYPALYTRVHSYLPWIRSITRPRRIHYTRPRTI